MGTVKLFAAKLAAKPKVYIAGPYSKGDVAVNVGAAVKAADAIMEAGFVPYVPHLTHFWHLMSNKPYEKWLEYDNEWIPTCDLLLRLPGESSGADKEVELARSLGIPVFTSLEDVLKLIEMAKFKNWLEKHPHE